MTVLDTAWQDTLDGQLPHHLVVTLRRVAISFLVAMLIGSVIGIAMGRHKGADLLLDPWLILFLKPMEWLLK